jgi:hypothetical protein
LGLENSKSLQLRPESLERIAAETRRKFASARIEEEPQLLIEWIPDI